MPGFRKGPRVKHWSAIAVVLAALIAGCGSTEPVPGPAGRPKDAVIDATGDQDRQIGLDLQHYLVRLCPPSGMKLRDSELKKYRRSPYFHLYVQLAKGEIALCDSISSIAVDGSRVTIHSGLEDNAIGHAAGLAFCNLVAGSDVADSTSGHELLDKEGDTIEVCPASI